MFLLYCQAEFPAMLAQEGSNTLPVDPGSHSALVWESFVDKGRLHLVENQAAKFPSAPWTENPHPHTALQGSFIFESEYKVLGFITAFQFMCIIVLCSYVTS